MHDSAIFKRKRIYSALQTFPCVFRKDYGRSLNNKKKKKKIIFFLLKRRICFTQEILPGLLADSWLSDTP